MVTVGSTFEGYVGTMKRPRKPRAEENIVALNSSAADFSDMATWWTFQVSYWFVISHSGLGS